jgi:nucleoside-triphosphatase THEP1
LNRALDAAVQAGAVTHADIGGFRTVWTPDPEGSADQSLLLLPYGICANGDGSVVARRNPERGMREVFSEVFDTDGVGALRAALPADSRADMPAAPPTRLIVMDELGFIESSAAGFQAAVHAALGGDIPVVGVLRLIDTPFIGSVREHPNVRVIEVTERNRDTVAHELGKEIINAL